MRQRTYRSATKNETISTGATQGANWLPRRKRPMKAAMTPTSASAATGPPRIQTQKIGPSSPSRPAHARGAQVAGRLEWRWGESNPRLPSSRRGFSERSRWRDLGPSPPTGGSCGPQPRWDVPPGHEARPGGEPLLMTSRFRPSGWAGRDALLISKQRVRGCPRQVLGVPALSRRSGDVGSLHPLRTSKSKPRTPLSTPAPDACEGRTGPVYAPPALVLPGVLWAEPVPPDRGTSRAGRSVARDEPVPDGSARRSPDATHREARSDPGDQGRCPLVGARHR